MIKDTLISNENKKGHFRLSCKFQKSFYDKDFVIKGESVNYEFTGHDFLPS
jgi:hypothetical protein